MVRGGVGIAPARYVEVVCPNIVVEDGGGVSRSVFLSPGILSSAGGVPVVLDRVFGSSGDVLCDLRPLVS